MAWTHRPSRRSVEMRYPDSRPAFFTRPRDLEAYDVVFVGFPIWWYVAPTIINTFLESFDFTGKTIVPFATSGGSGMGRTNEKLAPSCPGAKLLSGKVFRGAVSKSDLQAWADSLQV